MWVRIPPPAPNLLLSNPRDKITMGMFKIISKGSDQHVPGTGTFPAQNAPGAVERQGQCLRRPDKVQPLQDVLGTSPRLPVGAEQLRERLGQLCPFDRAAPPRLTTHTHGGATDTGGHSSDMPRL